MKVSFDFSENLRRAHVRRGGLLIDLGVPTRYKYTLGNESSGWQGDRSEGETAYSDIVGSAGRLLFFADPDEIDVGILSLRAKAPVSQPVEIYLNGSAVGRVNFATDRFSVEEVPFRGRLLNGVNTLEIRCAKSGVGPLSIDYVRIIPSVQMASEHITSFETPPPEEAEHSGISLAADESMTFHLFVPDGARLAVEASEQKTNGTLEVTITTDSETRTYRLVDDADDDENRLDIDLQELSGRAAAIRFTAYGDAVGLTEAAILQPTDPPEERTPIARNVLVLLIDTLRADRLKLFNRKSRVNAPNLSRLGTESVVFERTLAPSNWTKPSVATLMTGVSPRTHGANTHSAFLNDKLITASEHFRSRGFDTAGFVANGYITSRFGFGRGWDYFRRFGGIGESTNRGAAVVESALQWLKKRSRNNPFFMYVHTVDPHAPYVSPKRFRSLYQRFFYRGFIKPRKTASLLNDIRSGHVQLTPIDKAYLEALYDSEITYLDEVLGHLVRTLKKLSVLEETLLVITSDHGEEFFDHGSVGHGHSLYEELLRVPLVLRLPGRAHAGIRRSGETSLMDLFPTLCEMAGIPCPAQVRGRSLVDAFDPDGADPFPRPSVSEFPKQKEIAVRQGRYKAIFKGMSPVLFDLTSDPRETVDVSASHPITLAALRDALGDFLADEAALSAAPAAPHKAILDEESEAGLRALGYLGD